MKRYSCKLHIKKAQAQAISLRQYVKIRYMYQDWALPSNVAAALGYSGITIQNGIYHPDFTENPFGIVDINATLVQ